MATNQEITIPADVLADLQAVADAVAPDLLRRIRERSSAVSRQDRGESCAEGVNGHAAEGGEVPAADFLEPVRYAWTEAAYEARRSV